MKNLIAAIALVALAGSAQAEQCVQQKEKPADYYVMGTLVHPQSDVLASGDCDKSYDQLDKEYVATPKHQFADDEPTPVVVIAPMFIFTGR